MKPQFSPDAARVLDELERDPDKLNFTDAVWDTIDLITENSDSAAARRRALRSVKGHSVWLVYVPLRYNEDRWVILWQPRDDDALIAYIGPEDFGSSII